MNDHGRGRHDAGLNMIHGTSQQAAVVPGKSQSVAFLQIMHEKVGLELLIMMRLNTVVVNVHGPVYFGKDRPVARQQRTAFMALS